MLKFCQNFEYTQSMFLMLKEVLKRDPDTNSDNPDPEKYLQTE